VGVGVIPILTADQMRSIDRRTTAEFGIPSIVLMENAAVAVTDAIAERFSGVERAAIFCGPGANGGDGLAIARHLEQRGVVAKIILLGERDRYRDDAATNLSICERLNLPLMAVTTADSLDDALAAASECDLVVDAIFGTGLNRAPQGIYADAIRAFESLRLPIVSVDVPSGVNATTATLFDPAVQADVTVTFAAPKLAHVFEPAASSCGEIIVADISIPEMAMEAEDVRLSLITPADIKPLVSPRLSSSHKGTFGHVVIIGGSVGRSGAAILAVRGAIRGGAGLVSAVTDPETAKIISGASVESMTFPIDRQVASIDRILEFLKNKAAAVVGPGLPDDERSYEFVRALLPRIECPLVIDASALNACGGRIGEINPSGRPCVLTPHPGEMGRLLERSTGEINADRLGAAREAASRSKCVVVLKGHQTLIADPEGHIAVNPTGNPGMSTGGMGDVLGGLVAAFLARGVDPFNASCAASYLHGLAGDLLKDHSADIGMTALDLADAIPRAIAAIRQ
jgi:hydroxyethylthiazole kinase-like uncharacterized protein yjeF